MHISLISIGDELLSGATVDTNTPWLARRLHEHGCHVISHRTVGDQRSLIAAIFKEEFTRADVIITTGGLGPTDDDLTREGLADALGVELHAHPAAEAHLKDFFERIGRKLTPTQFRQAQLPAGCEMIPNAWGTAPAFKGRAKSCRFFVLPGVPVEMRNLFDAAVLPELQRGGGGRCTLVRVVRCFGATEADIGERVADLMRRGRNPAVGITAADAVIGVRINATGDSPEAAQALLDADVQVVRSRLGLCVFGMDEDTLQGVVARMLIEHAPIDCASGGPTLATAESCTGGLLAQSLTEMPGASAFFLRGYVTYADQAKTDMLGVPPGMLDEHGAVSEAVAVQMAAGCRRAAGADFALSITGIAGPEGGSDQKPVGLVYVGCSDQHETRARRLNFGTHLSRRDIRTRTCHTALNLLRLRLIEGRWRA